MALSRWIGEKMGKFFGTVPSGPDELPPPRLTLEDRIQYIWKQVRLYIKNDAYSEGDFTLSSGKKSDFYLEMANVINNCLCLPRLVELLHREIVQILRDHQPEYARKANWEPKPGWWQDSLVGLAGIALGGAQLVSAYTARHPYLNSLTIRIHEEDWDEDGNSWWGEIETSPHIKKGKVILIDDVLTTGNSLLFAKDLLEHDGFTVYKTFVVVDRQEGGLEKCKEKGLEVKSFFTIKDILEES
jgi:orotate phosphoribosyltransferase